MWACFYTDSQGPFYKYGWTDIWARISNDMHIFLWDWSTHLFPNVDMGLAKSSLKLGPGWITTYGPFH